MAKNKVPTYIRDRKQQEHKTKRTKIQGKHFLHFPKAFWGLLVFLSVIAGVVSLFPKLSVDLSGTIRANDPLGTVFYLANEGIVPIHDVNALCEIVQSGNAHLNIHNFSARTRHSHAETLSPGHKMTVGCENVIATQGAVRGELTITVDYKVAWTWWYRHTEFPMLAEESEDGTWVWTHLPK